MGSNKNLPNLHENYINFTSFYGHVLQQTRRLIEDTPERNPNPHMADLRATVVSPAPVFRKLLRHVESEIEHKPHLDEDYILEKELRRRVFWSSLQTSVKGLVTNGVCKTAKYTFE